MDGLMEVGRVLSPHSSHNHAPGNPANSPTAWIPLTFQTRVPLTSDFSPLASRLPICCASSAEIQLSPALSGSQPQMGTRDLMGLDLKRALAGEQNE
jgi:hypothetical protein